MRLPKQSTLVFAYLYMQMEVRYCIVGNYKFLYECSVSTYENKN